MHASYLKSSLQHFLCFLYMHINSTVTDGAKQLHTLNNIMLVNTLWKTGGEACMRAKLNWSLECPPVGAD